MQKEIWMADFKSVVSSEQSGIRPVIIISGDAMNSHYSVVIMCPLTSKIKPYQGCPVISPDNINNLKTTSQAIPFHIRTISKIRLTKKIGIVTDAELKNIKRGLEMFLKY